MATPDESTALQPADNVSPWSQFLTELRVYFVSNVAASVITIWSVFLFTGGLIFLVYFWSIGFMPEMDAKALVTLLAVSVLTGSILLLGLIVYLFAPLVLWKILMPNYERLQILWYKDGQYAPVRAILWVGLPFVVIGGGFFCYLYLARNTWGISEWWGASGYHCQHGAGAPCEYG
jgi:hypothetical protein